MGSITNRLYQEDKKILEVEDKLEESLYSDNNNEKSEMITAFNNSGI
jgi:hypothetical protein